MTAEEAMNDLIVKRKNKSGTGAYGIYVNVIECDDDGKLAIEYRYFLAGKVLCTYARKNGNARTNWTATSYDTHDDARVELLSKLINVPGGKGVMVNGKPLLVELDGNDISAIEKGETPSARFLASAMMERRVKIDDATWRMPSAEA